MLKPEVKQQWVEALRSGKYKQSKEVLRSVKENVEGFCCLGVLCDISDVGEWREARNISYRDISKAGEWRVSTLISYRYCDQNEEEGASYPPKGVIALVLEDKTEKLLISSLKDPEGFTQNIHRWDPNKTTSYLITRSVFEGLTAMNDNGATFEEIADVIEKYL